MATGWATPTPRTEFNGVGRENQPGYSTSSNDPFLAPGRNAHPDLRVKELKSQIRQIERAYNTEHEENIALQAEIKVLQCVDMSDTN